MKRDVEVKEVFLVAAEAEAGGTWVLKLVGEHYSKTEALRQAEAGIRFDGTETFVIPCYKSDIKWVADDVPVEFANVEPKGELPNPVTQPIGSDE